MDDGAVREILAKSRRLVLVSRNLSRLLARRVEPRERIKPGADESARGQLGQTATMTVVAGRARIARSGTQTASEFYSGLFA